MSNINCVKIGNMAKPKPLLLIILDGFGISLEKEGNPVYEAKKPTLDEIERNFPFTTLQASGVAVGLPWGEAGNSEVGHLTMGAGRVIYHHLPRIINAISDGSFFKNPAFIGAAEHVRKNKSRLHIAGLVSSGSVHSYIDHLYALLDFTKKEKLEEVHLHIFTDGKDAPPQEGVKFIELLEERIKKEWPQTHLATVVGRFYAMDRDEKWERIQTSYGLLTGGKGEKITSIPEYIRTQYKKDLTDEFIGAAVADGNGIIKDGDALIFFNFREDSMRELAHAFADEDFDKFPRKKSKNLFLVTMTEYQKDLKAHAAFEPLDIGWPLARILGEAGLRHLHIAETEKYAHVTYFLNGGTEKLFPGEERILIPSITAAHFDEVPEMRAKEITAKILEYFDTYDVIIANFANADLVGHSGNFQAAIRAVEILDGALQQIMNAVLASDGAALITGDHGNIELKRNVITGEKLTEHSLNAVPLYLIGRKFRLTKQRSESEREKQKTEAGGMLTDIAPTILELLGLKKPAEMTGKDLLKTLLGQ